MGGCLATGILLFGIWRSKPDPDEKSLLYLAQMTLAGWCAMFLLRAVLAPFAFILLSGGQAPSAAAPVVVIGILGTLAIAVSTPVALVALGLKKGVSKWHVAVAGAMSAVSNLFLAGVLLLSYTV